LRTPTPRSLAIACSLAALGSLVPGTAQAADALALKSGFMQVVFSGDHPGLESLAIDGVGSGKLGASVLSPESAPGHDYAVASSAIPGGIAVGYSRGSHVPGRSPEWAFEAGPREIEATSTWSAGHEPAPLTLTFDTGRCYATLLGLFDPKGDIALPAVLHLPGFGSVTLIAHGAGKASVGYASGKGWVKVTFPPADAGRPTVTYRWTVSAIFPRVAGIAGDARYDGFRRNWLNILQLNPSRRLLSNNTSSDVCGFCYYEYADIALRTPPLVGDLQALDLIRQSLDQILAGTKTYGMPGYGDFPEETSDTAPSLLIAAYDYASGRSDATWLELHYGQLRVIADRMLATDSDGDGLIKYVATGNSGSWNEGQPKVRPSNWWDTIGFGHEDAYANALAYRALLGMRDMAAMVGRQPDVARYALAAEKLHDAYYPAFFDPATGVLGGWRSADGSLHDYYFTFVNGIAVLYGLVPADKAGPIMDHLWDKMLEVGFNNFRMGLPGNLVSVARRDYAHKEPRYGGGRREDNADGFQVYCNGGATACFAYFTIAAYESVGQHERAQNILLPVLQAFDAREFEGTGSNRLTNDWRKWDGTAEGYEGFLTDNYYALLAVPPPRAGSLKEVDLDQADAGRAVLADKLQRVASRRKGRHHRRVDGIRGKGKSTGLGVGRGDSCVVGPALVALDDDVRLVVEVDLGLGDGPRDVVGSPR
jgi:hypothetical protein